MPHAKYLLSTLLALIIFSVSCSSDAYPRLPIPRGEVRDSLAFVLMVGDSLSRTDTLLLAEGAESLNPDSNLYREAYVSYDVSEGVHYYRLTSGEWVETQVPISQDTLAKTLPDFYTADVMRKVQNLHELSQAHKLAIYFAGWEHKMPTRQELKKLKDRYPKDSLRFVYMYLTPSDSTAKRLMKRDSLTGLAFSDTIGEVSRLRERMGIARSNKLELVVVDSTQSIIYRAK